MARPYFAYGSNLHRGDFERWCLEQGADPASVRLREPAHLPDHEPVFHYRSVARRGGALDVHPRPGSAVSGALFDVTEAGWALLDRKEGVASGRYHAVEVTALTSDGRLVPARTYRVVPDRREGFVAPADDYVALVCEGLRALGLSDAPVRAAARGEPPPAHPGAIFVYGTLMRGQVQGALLEDHAPVSVCEASVPGRLVALGWYPGLVPPAQPSDRVHGEVFRFERVETLIPALDAYEDFRGYEAPDSLYHRVLLEAVTAEGPRLAWVYLYVGPTAGATRVLSGRWTDR